MADYGTSVGAAAVGKCTEILVDPVLKLIWNRITSVFKWESNLKNLKKKADKLAVERERLLQFTEAAERREEEAAMNVKNWLTSADNYLGKMEKLWDEEDKVKKKCFAGFCPNPKSRYQISKKVEEYLDVVAPLLEEAARFKIPDFYCSPPKEISSAPVRGFEQFDSRMPALNCVMEALRSASVQKIGIHGLPGVGKTMLAKEVAKQARVAQLFDVIVMASVKKNPDLKRIQGEIADKLRLQLHGETEFGRANQLKAYLKKQKRVLVILDDIWLSLDLDELGIPSVDEKNEACSIGEEQTQCKILFTSRFLKVLSCDMHTQKDFEVGRLQDEEAWELLKKIVGGEIEKSLLPTAKEIAKECGGLPLAVEAVAKVLKIKSPPVWRNALLQLKRPSPENFTAIPANVYKAIELSFDHLESKELQQILLLCSMLGNNASIEDLSNYGFGLGLFHNVNTTEEARDRVLALVSDLKSCSLLLNGSIDIHFEMHDIVRDVAISIGLRDHHALSLIDDYVPKEWSDREVLEGFKWISLLYADISELPDELECPELTLFSLCCKDPSMKIPENLFQRMQKLRVLNFSKMHFPSLPSSICLLKNLQTLHVTESVLEDMAIIGKLMSLEVLSLSGCDIEELPMEIGQLTQLKLLDLSNCAKLKVIQPHLLARLSKLEELYLGNSFDQWDIREEDRNRSNASVAELKDLHNLASLDVCVCDIQLVPEDLFSERLRRYKIFIGEVWKRSWDSFFKSSKILKLELNTSISYDHSIGMLLKKTEELHLKELKGVKNVVYELDVEGFQELKYLYVRDAPEVQHIINSGEWARFHAFPILEALYLQNLNNLMKICLGRLRATSFSKLTKIYVECCNQLKNLFPFLVARRLLQLKEIGVRECSNMVEIVDEERQGATNDTADEAKEYFELVQLKSLILQSLPKFIRLWHGNEETCFNSAPLFNEKVVFPNLEELQLSWLNIESIWGSHLSCVQSLTRVIIKGCDNLKHLLSSSMAKSLVQLRYLKIKRCKRIREIIQAENAEEMEDSISLPKLDFLNIDDLEMLTTFCSGNCSVEFPSLKQMWIHNCPELKGFTVNHTSTGITGGLEPLFNEKVGFPSLEELQIVQLDNLRIIWQQQLPANSFIKLKSLTVGSCDKLSTIFPLDILRRLCTSLEELHVCHCCGVEEIFELGEINMEESHTVVDTQFRKLTIISLQRLKHVWNKDPLGILTFWNLQSVTTVNCQSLRNLFPASVAMGLQQLEKLELNGCGIEEVVALGEGDEAVTKFVFSGLTTLRLWDLPRLRYFYPRRHVIELPKLKKSITYHCHGVKETNGGSLAEFPVHLPLFSMEKVISRLEKLSLTSDEIAMICNRQYQGDLFSEVKVLYVQCYKKESDIFPIFFLERFHNLEKLRISCSKFKELFPSATSIDCQKKQLGSHLRIRKLKLSSLYNLKYICSEDSRLDLLLPNVESLKVQGCGSLISLSESTCTASFRNLTTLLVNGCEGLRNLFSFATVQSLVQLQTLQVEQCHLLTEIIGDEGDALKDVIVFSKLKVLKLVCLTRLTSFCSGKFTFKFPLLEQVMVTQSPKLETFCHGVLKTPILQRIQLTTNDDVGHPVVELNYAINQLYIEKVGYAGLQHLNLSEFPKLMEIWNQNPQEILDFRRLNVLEISNCGNMRYLLTPSMALSLVVLRTLKVKKCEIIEQIIIEERAMEVAGNELILPQLHGIDLKSCPKLTSFCARSYKLVCPSLTEIDVSDCPNIFIFPSAFSTEQVKEAADRGSEERNIGVPIESFLNDQVEFSSSLHLNLSSMNVKQIFHTKLSTMSSVVQGTRELTLEGCGNLKYLFTSSMIRSFEQLERLNIHDCKKLKEVIMTEGLATEERVFFPKLRMLNLKLLPELTRFCLENYSVFPCLTHLHICNCRLLETFISGSTIEYKSDMTRSKRVKKIYTSALFDTKVAFPSLEELKIHYMERLRKIWDDQLDASSFYKLLYLGVDSCKKLLNVFPVTMLERFQNLDKLEIKNCDSIDEIFEPNALSGSETNALETVQSTLAETTPNFVFPKVTYLLLESLPRLKSIYPQIHTTEWPSLKGLEVYGCNRVQILASELLSYHGKSEENQIAISNQSSLFWVSEVTFPNLEELRLEMNDNMKEIWYGDDVKNCIVFTKLKSLQLKVLPRLASFCSVNCNFEFPSLKDLIMMACPQMLNFSGGEVRTPTLQKVKLTEDPEDKGCWEGDLNLTIQQLFRKKVGYFGIQYLKLFEFPGLLEIWDKNPQEFLDFKRITDLEICNCGTLRYLLTPSLALNLVVLQRLNVKNCKKMEQIITKDGAVELTEKNIIFKQLHSIDLASCSNLTSFCVGSYNLVFPTLEKVTIVECLRMVTFLSTFSTMQVKEAVNGGNEEQIDKKDIDIPAEAFLSDQVEFSSSLHLNLSSMNVKQIFHTKLSTMSSVVQSTRELTLEGCDNLKYLFTSSMIRSFVQLEWLNICDCKKLKEVIMIEGLAKEERVFFPKLRMLNLEFLPELTRFCLENYFGFPCLTHLHICKCRLLETFISGSTIEYKSDMTKSKRVKKIYTSALFDRKVAFPCLEELQIHHMGRLRKIWDDQLDASSFYELLYLGVDSCKKLLHVFPVTMLERLQNLDKLEIKNCDSIDEIFEPHARSGSETNVLETVQSTLAETAPNFVFPKVTYLLLKSLPRLRSFYPQIHTTEWLSLKGLEVYGCNRVQILASELLSYRGKSEENQITISNQSPLFWVSKATFPSLEELRVEMNDNMKEIWHGDDVKNCIVFTKLKTLQLKVLPRLSSFCLVNCNFEFPSLKDLIVMACPQMLNFSGGELGTSTLQKVKLTEDPEDEGCWEGDVNLTIQQLFRKKVGYFGIQYLKLSEFPELLEIWNKNPQEILDFKRLTDLEIRNCGTLRYLLTPSMALNLVVLQRLKVKNCKKMEQIITKDGDVEVAEKNIIFKQLVSIYLASCSNLTSFYIGSYKLVCPTLKEVTVIECPKIVTFPTTFSTMQVKGAAEGGNEEQIDKKDNDIPADAFSSDQVEFSRFLRLNMSSMNMKLIFHKQLPALSSIVQSLGTLTRRDVEIWNTYLPHQ